MTSTDQATNPQQDQQRLPDEEALLAHAREHFPALVEGAQRWSDVPFLDRDRARPWYREDVPGAQVFRSTGTSGFPKPIGWAEHEEAFYVGDKQALLGPWLRGVERAFVSLAVGHNANSARLLLGNLGIAVHDAGLSPLDLQVQDVADFDPQLLYCSPTILLRLLDELDGAGRTLPSVSHVVTNGEVLLPAWRSRILAAFALPPERLIDTYGSTEVGTIAATCPDCGAMHLMPGIVGEAVPADQARALALDTDALAGGGDLLALTHVGRTSFPVVRFVTYDVVRGLRRERCGDREVCSIDAVLGRCDDVLSYGELFPAYELGDLMAELVPGRRWFAFNPENALTLLVEAESVPGFHAAFTARFPLHAELVDLGLLPPPEVLCTTRMDEVLTRSGLPADGGKAARRVHHELDRSWLTGLLA